MVDLFDKAQADEFGIKHEDIQKFKDQQKDAK